MRARMLGAVLMLGACTRAPSPRVVLGGAERDIAALEAAHPIDAGANVRIDALERTPAESVHLVQVRGAERPHRHLTHDLFVCVLRGEGVLTVGTSRTRLRAGDVAFVPRGTPHWFANTGSGIAMSAVTFAPPLDAPDSVPVDDVDSPPSSR